MTTETQDDVQQSPEPVTAVFDVVGVTATNLILADVAGTGHNLAVTEDMPKTIKSGDTVTLSIDHLGLKTFVSHTAAKVKSKTAAAPRGCNQKASELRMIDL